MEEVRQIPSCIDYTADKRYCDLLYALLQVMSYKDGYIDKKDVVFTQIAKELGVSRQTVSTKFKNLMEMGLLEEQEEKGMYRLARLDNSVCRAVPASKLQRMVDSKCMGCVSGYVYLLEAHKISTNGMKKFIGISTKAVKNNETIKEIMKVLEELGLISRDEGKIVVME